MRQMIKDFLAIAAASFPVKDPVYEFGALQVPGQEGFADLRPLFPGNTYVGTDIRQGPGVDKVLDLHAIDLPSGSVGTIVCMDVLEHVEYPHKALEEIHRVLAPDGKVIISSVMCFPIHDYPHDYWRFTPEGFRSLLKAFREPFIGYAGREDLPHTVVGIGFKGNVPQTAEFVESFHKWKARYDKEDFKDWPKQIVKLLTPPILLRAVSYSYRRVTGTDRKGAPKF